MGAIQANSALHVPALSPNLTIRPGIPADEAFIDHCQKMFSGHLGFLYQGTIAKKVAKNEVLVAVDGAGHWVGYVMGTTAYDRNDAVSRIDQIAVVPSLHRQQTGGALLAEWVRRLPYGCTLISCWCAQDLKENRFWEAMGFVPLAFRAGGQTQRRVHIFWQRRTRTGDVSTPFWYPKETSNGAMSAARIILPIPPGADWSQIELPRILPQQGGGFMPLLQGPVSPAALVAGKRPKRFLLEGKAAPGAMTPGEYAQRLREKSKHLQARGPISPAVAGRQAEASQIVPAAPKAEKVARPKNAPEHVAAAREIRDRWLEQMNASGVVEAGKYDPTRMLEASGSVLGPVATALLAAVTGPSDNPSALPDRLITHNSQLD